MVDPYKSDDATLMVGVEANQGVPVTPNRTFGKVAEDATPPDPTNNWNGIHVVGGDREVFQRHKGHTTYQNGSIPVILIDGAPVAFAFGKDSQSGASHTITPQLRGKPKTQTIETTFKGRGGGSNLTRRFRGAVPNQLELSMNNDDELTATLSYWAMGVRSIGTPAPEIGVPPDRNPWLFSDASTALTLFGSPFARLESFTFTLNNNLREGRYIAPAGNYPTERATDPYEIMWGNADYNLTATITVVDGRIYNRLIEANPGTFLATIAFTRPNGDTFTLRCKECQFESAPHTIPGDSAPVSVEATMLPESVEVVVQDSYQAAAPYL